ncbi:hypothetical protein HNE05_07970 [Aquipseudomonas campi]|uniref:Lipoprotein n=1 Tax=Aquipseudomonas campi TaxID=2731681 RepID=A0A6M8FGN3_9GAMM|nr:hypothetical protein [Pseudomonas campi]QKE63300.1 hypothetical protein HNE05_07970 [Pseudomonas campi]
MKNTKSLFLAALLTPLLASCAGPKDLIRAHAYSPPQKPASDIATVYSVWGGFSGEMSFICKVDGKSYYKLGLISDCPSVVYLTPGKHSIAVKYKFANYFGHTSIDLEVLAGKTYKLTGTSTDDLKTATFNIVEMPSNFELTYKDLIPSLRSESNQPVLPTESNY